MPKLGELDLETAARGAAGNWQLWSNSCWFRAKEHEGNGDWAVFYTCGRDSDLLAGSNAADFATALEPFIGGDDPDVLPEHHSHWAVGWVEGFAIRIFRNGEITEAFRTYHALTQRLLMCPVLDKADHSHGTHSEWLGAYDLISHRRLKRRR